MFNVSFAEVAQALAVAGASVPASEGHGCLCGALCAFEHYPVERWLEEIVPDEAVAPTLAGAAAANGSLAVLFADTTRSLRSEEMEFSPFLPDDETPLSQRAEALAQWCQGFLYGLGTGTTTGRDPLPGDTDEVLRDMSEIARASAADTDGGEEDEAAYSELVEFIRVSAQLLHDELAPRRQPRPV